jgi:hypothetical protein
MLKLTLFIFVLSLELTYPTDISHLNQLAVKQLLALSFHPYANIFPGCNLSPENQELVDTDDKVHLNEVYGYTK